MNVAASSRELLRVVASSNDNARLIELMQVQTDQGPCLDCYRTGLPVDVTDIATAVARWPVFVAAVTAEGDPTFRSVHAVPLRLRGQAIGALNVFGRRAGALPAGDLELGQALADVATIAILQERAIRHAEVLTEQLQHALTSRVIVEQAKGVLAQYSGLGMDQALDQLRGYARGHNLGLSEVARAVTERRLDPETVFRETGPGARPGAAPKQAPKQG
jgi:GAF domain-containing protein